MASEYLDDIHGGRDILYHVSTALKELSFSFGDVGNEKVSEDLYNMAKDIDTAAKQMVDAVARELNDNFQQTNKELGNLLVACIDHSLVKEETHGTI